MLLVAFGIKAAVFPLSFWLPDSYPTAPAPVTAVFAGLLTKVGVYAMVRTETLLFPGDTFGTPLMVVALLTMVVGILGALAQSDIKRLLSFTLVSHIGYMVFGLAMSSVAGLGAAVFYVAHHITIQTSLFLVTGPDRTAGRQLLDGPRRRSCQAVSGACGAVLRAGHEPRRHPAVLRIPGQARPAAGRRPARNTVGLCAGDRRRADQPADPAGIARVWNRAFWRKPEDAEHPDPVLLAHPADSARGDRAGKATSPCCRGPWWVPRWAW